MSLNRVILIGNLGRDPEIRTTQSGTNVTSFSVATSEKWKDKSGDLQEKTEWHRIVVWGRQAESCNEYLFKGRPVCIEGKIQTREYEDRDGVTKRITEIIASNVIFLGQKGDSESSGGSHSSSPGKSSGKPSGKSKPASTPPPDDDDIPF